MRKIISILIILISILNANEDFSFTGNQYYLKNKMDNCTKLPKSQYDLIVLSKQQDMLLYYSGMTWRNTMSVDIFVDMRTPESLSNKESLFIMNSKEACLDFKKDYKFFLMEIEKASARN